MFRSTLGESSGYCTELLKINVSPYSNMHEPDDSPNRDRNMYLINNKYTAVLHGKLYCYLLISKTQREDNIKLCTLHCF